VARSQENAVGADSASFLDAGAGLTPAKEEFQWKREAEDAKFRRDVDVQPHVAPRLNK